MIEKKVKYDPLIYGELRSKFLNKIDFNSSEVTILESDEELRQDIIKQIKEVKKMSEENKVENRYIKNVIKEYHYQNRWVYRILSGIMIFGLIFIIITVFG